MHWNQRQAIFNWILAFTVSEWSVLKPEYSEKTPDNNATYYISKIQAPGETLTRAG